MCQGEAGEIGVFQGGTGEFGVFKRGAGEVICVPGRRRSGWSVPERSRRG